MKRRPAAEQLAQLVLEREVQLEPMPFDNVEAVEVEPWRWRALVRLARLVMKNAKR